MTDLLDPGVLTDGVVELRRWQDNDIAAVRAAQGGTIDEALAWVRRQHARPPTGGVSCAVALSGQAAAGYIGLIRRPRVEMGVVRALDDGQLVYRAHERIVGIGYWIAPDVQRQGLATRATVLISRWALHSAGIIRIEALLDPRNVASRRVVEKSGFRPEGQLRSYLELDGRSTDALGLLVAAVRSLISATSTSYRAAVSRRQGSLDAAAVWSAFAARQSSAGVAAISREEQR